MRRWWETGVVYQVYPRSFRDTDGDGIGNVAGVTEKIDYLATTLGVDAIWLSPFYPSPQKDFGYDVANYVDVEPDYGTLADFDERPARMTFRATMAARSRPGDRFGRSGEIGPGSVSACDGVALRSPSVPKTRFHSARNSSISVSCRLSPSRLRSAF